jgi:hypothetical protein
LSVLRKLINMAPCRRYQACGSSLQLVCPGTPVFEDYYDDDEEAMNDYIVFQEEVKSKSQSQSQSQYGVVQDDTKPDYSDWEDYPSEQWLGGRIEPHHTGWSSEEPDYFSSRHGALEPSHSPELSGGEGRDSEKWVVGPLCIKNPDGGPDSLHDETIDQASLQKEIAGSDADETETESQHSQCSIHKETEDQVPSQKDPIGRARDETVARLKQRIILFCKKTQALLNRCRTFTFRTRGSKSSEKPYILPRKPLLYLGDDDIDNKKYSVRVEPQWNGTQYVAHPRNWLRALKPISPASATGSGDFDAERDIPVMHPLKDNESEFRLHTPVCRLSSRRREWYRYALLAPITRSKCILEDLGDLVYDSLPTDKQVEYACRRATVDPARRFLRHVGSKVGQAKQSDTAKDASKSYSR